MLGLFALGLLAAASTSHAQSSGAWFGLPLPGPVTDQVLDFGNIAIPRIPAPPVGKSKDLEGQSLMRTVSDVVAFALQSRDQGPKIWGRMAGGTAANNAIDYVDKQLRDAGYQVERWSVPFVRVDNVRDWSVRVIGAPEFGPNSSPVTLASAVPTYVERKAAEAPSNSGAVLPFTQPREIPLNLSVTAPIIYVGDGSQTVLTGLDVRGKIAILKLAPVPSHFYQYSDINAATSALAAAGAVGMVIIYDMPGNMQLRYASCPASIPCFTVGGDDGGFLQAIVQRAAKARHLDKLRIELGVQRDPPASLQAPVLLAKLAGRDSRENIVVSAHSDSYFAGANDNASGVAALIGLARTFAKGPKPKHDIYFFLSAGHHDQTGGTGALAKQHPEIASNNIVLLNLEHIGQAGVYRSYVPLGSTDRYGNPFARYVPTNGDSQGREVTLWPDSPAIRQAWKGAAVANAFTGPAGFTKSSVGESPMWVEMGGNMIQDVETSPWYHTSGDTVETIAPETMQRATLTYRDFIRKMDMLDRQAVLAGSK